jgi:predicted ABC-type ATPase
LGQRKLSVSIVDFSSTNEPILLRLQRGDRFPFHLLRVEREAVCQYWVWWWSKAEYTSLQRPATLVDSDPVLEPTANKATVNTVTDDYFFSEVLRHALRKNLLPTGIAVVRADFRQSIADMLCPRCHTSDSPVVVFTGGGYGAGKTSSLHFLASLGKAPGGITPEALHGVDYCKQLLPEFNLVKMVADGRASEITQAESRLTSDLLFSQLISDRRSFGWDSSMSDKSTTLKKMEYARSQGYRLIMLAVLTDVEVAVRRAMTRAFKTRRFSPPRYLHDSHGLFCAHLLDYVEEMDEVTVVENSQETTDGGPRILATKAVGEKALKVFDARLFASYTSNRPEPA